LESNNSYKLTDDGYTIRNLEFFATHKIRYMSKLSLSGKSRLSHNFDFAIPRTEKQPERIIKTIDSIDGDKAKVLIFS